MRQSQAEKALTHERIVATAAAQIREQGIEGPGVAEIMQAAGLTHGGFYKHFASRDELVLEAADRAFGDASRAIQRRMSGEPDELTRFVDWYLSPAHRDDPGSACPVAGLVGDVPRAQASLRAGYRTLVQEYIDALVPQFGSGEAARRRANAAVSMLVGALTLARAVDDESLSKEILENARDFIQRLRGGSDQQEEA